MPTSAGGTRRLAEEKTLLSELSKLFHIIKANHKEQRNGRETATPAAAATTTAHSVAAPIKAARQRAKVDTRRGSRRRSRHGGSVWIVLKGGFGPRSVPTATDTRVVARRASGRAVLSEQRRVRSLAEAEAFVESAWQQAREAELLGSDGTPTDEGDAYLAEQYATASRMLCTTAVGTHLHQLVAQHCSSGAGAAVAATAAVAEEEANDTLTASQWAEQCRREAAILFHYQTSATPSGTADDYVAAQQSVRSARYFFTTAEPVTESGDVVANKCIVRIRDSQRNKHTAILSTAKAVNYIRSNLGQVLRKELSGSRLPRSGVEEVDATSAGAGAAAGKSSHTSQAHSGATAAGHTNNGKKRRRR
ncbi:hypothetical protein NESM_000832600 [Novymonas esmeraldas]|uniref:Uncharacterized protein n=1 Tax=Novymonas esmeraldas TaxID=1808958 RepID=A0AAW0F0J0_9TRYP